MRRFGVRLAVMAIAIAGSLNTVAGGDRELEDKQIAAQIKARNSRVTTEPQVIRIETKKSGVDLSGDVSDGVVESKVGDQLHEAQSILQESQESLAHVRALEKRRQAQFEARMAEERAQREEEKRTSDARIRMMEEKAKQALEDAETLHSLARVKYAERMKQIELMEAQRAEEIARERAVAERELSTRVAIQRFDPVSVMNERVSVDMSNSTIKEVAQKIMPEGWTIETHFINNPKLNSRAVWFTTTEKRHPALMSLVNAVKDARIGFHYMWELVDDEGKPAPKLILTDVL